MGNAGVSATDRGTGALRDRDSAARRRGARLPKDDAKDAASHDRTRAKTREEADAVAKTVPFRELAESWSRDAAFRTEYERIGPAMELAFALAEARRES